VTLPPEDTHPSGTPNGELNGTPHVPAPVVNTSFSPLLPTLQLAWDSTSLGAFKTCPRLYQLSILEGYAPRMESVHLTFGQHYHSALEAYDHCRAAGGDYEAACREAVLTALRGTWADGHPWNSEDKYKNRLTLLRTVVWYLAQFEDDPFETVLLANGRPAVELSFRLNSGFMATTGEEFLLCGHMDRIATHQGITYIVDRKTTKSQLDQSFIHKFSPDNQFTTYILAGTAVWALPVRGIIVDGAQVAVTFSRFERGIVERHQTQLQEWYRDWGLWVGMANTFAQMGYWPMNDKSCVDGSTVVSVTRGTRKGWKMPISHLYELFHGINAGPRYQTDLKTQVLSDVGGHVAFQDVLDVVRVAVTDAYRLVTSSGKVLEATGDHEIKTPYGWERLDCLIPGKTVICWASHEARPRAKAPRRQTISKLYYYPKGFSHKNKGNGLRNRKLGATQRRSILVAEAQLNGLTLSAFVQTLRTDPEAAKNLQYLAQGLEVHHIDGNCQNDHPDNLVALAEQEHKALHPMGASTNATHAETVVSVEPCGLREVYDIMMEAPHHNFVADGIVVHNCQQYGGCPFRGICSKPPSVRESWLKADFTRRMWDPLRVRGDI
jgi:hypothetical protein